MVFKAGEQTNVIEVTFNRDLQPEGVFDTGQPQSLLFELMSPDGNTFRRHGELEVKGNLARFIARDPNRWEQPGDYRLTVFGDDAQTGPAFLAADDEYAARRRLRQPGGRQPGAAGQGSVIARRVE